MYLKISNPGICAIESFTVLGVGTSRGDDSKIGRFQTGSKNGVLVCLRHSINPEIYLGNEKVTFFTEPLIVSDKKFSRVCYSYKDKIEKLSMTLDFGSHDWPVLSMAIREFVSNALDAVSGEISQLSIEVVTEVKPIDNCTTIYLPLTPEVQKYYNELGDNFLHFNTGNKIDKVILPKDDNSPAKIYRKGVFVRNLGKRPSLFDYNFGEELKIDDCRNLNDYEVKYAIGKTFGKASVKELENIFTHLDKIEEYAEGELGMYDITSVNTKNWKEAFENCYGDSVLASGCHSGILDKVKAKGYNIKLVTAVGWYGKLSEAGVKLAHQVLGADKDGKSISPATAVLINRVMKIWNKLDGENLTHGENFPDVKIFTEIVDGGTKRAGYYKDNTIFIEKEHTNNDQTILEELAHHISKSNDNSRDFQEFAFKVATIFMGLSRRRAKSKDIV